MRGFGKAFNVCLLLLTSVSSFSCGDHQSDSARAANQAGTFADYHRLRESEERRWNTKILEATIRSENPAILKTINDTLDNLTQPYPDSWPLNFADLEPLPLDSTITTLCEIYISGTPKVREYIRSQIVAPQGASLLIFSQRTAVLAERSKSPDLIRRGLIALAIENLASGDVRDDLIALSLVLHCARRIKLDPKGLCKDVSQISGPAISSVLDDFLRRDLKDQSIREMGFEEVKNDKGVGYRWPAAQYR